MNETGLKKILLVEDSMITALAEASMIMKEGYEVICIPDGESAVEIALNDFSIDLILMDIDLGSGIDGPTAADLIIKKRDIPVVFLTSHSEREIVDKVRSITRYGYIIKNSGDFVILSSLEMAFELFEAHKKTKESEANFRYLAASKNEAFALCDAKMNKLIYTSPAIKDIFKYEAALEDDDTWLITYLNMIHPDDLFKLIKAKNMLLAYGETCTEEYRIICNDGDKKWIKGTAFPVYNDAGELIKFAAVVEDITLRKYAEEALLKNEAKFRSYIQNAPMAILIADNNGNFIDVNAEAAKGLGYTEEELLTLNIKSIIDPSNREVYSKHLTIMVKEGRVTSDLLFRKKDGSILWAQVNAVKLSDDRFISFSQDITPRKKAEILLYESDERMRHIFDNLPVGIFQSTIDGKFIYLNPVVSKTLGYDSIEELAELSRRSSVADVIYEDPGKRVHFMREATSEPENWKIFDNRLKRKDGTILDVVMAFCERPDPVNGEIYLYGYGIDVTGKKAAEDEIKRLLSEKELLLKEVHHRIKNNMSVVASLLYLQSESMSDATAVSALDDARNRIMSMMLIYDKLYRTVDYKNVNCSEYVSNLVDEIALTFKVNGRSIVIEKDIGDFHMDSQSIFPIGLIVNEIITNAFKHAFHGRNSGNIYISIHICETLLKILIKDDGVGIPDSFDIKTTEGFGLGLVNILVQQMNGSLEITTDMGTEYRIAVEV